MDLLPHNAIFLTKHCDLLIIIDHLLELRVFLLQDQQLLMEIVSATLAFEVQNILQMLDFFLELGDECIILSTDLVLTDFCHDFLSSIGEL